MAFATVNSKGQMTIPKDIRAAANLKPGDRIHFTVLENRTIIVRVKNRSIRDISFSPPRRQTDDKTKITTRRCIFGVKLHHIDQYTRKAIFNDPPKHNPDTAE